MDSLEFNAQRTMLLKLCLYFSLWLAPLNLQAQSTAPVSRIEILRSASGSTSAEITREAKQVKLPANISFPLKINPDTRSFPEMEIQVWKGGKIQKFKQVLQLEPEEENALLIIRPLGNPGDLVDLKVGYELADIETWRLNYSFNPISNELFRVLRLTNPVQDALPITCRVTLKDQDRVAFAGSMADLGGSIPAGEECASRQKVETSADADTILIDLANVSSGHVTRNLILDHEVDNAKGNIYPGSIEFTQAPSIQPDSFLPKIELTNQLSPYRDPAKVLTLSGSNIFEPAPVDGLALIPIGTDPHFSVSSDLETLEEFRVPTSLEENILNFATCKPYRVHCSHNSAANRRLRFIHNASDERVFQTKHDVPGSVRFIDVETITDEIKDITIVDWTDPNEIRAALQQFEEQYDNLLRVFFKKATTPNKDRLYLLLLDSRVGQKISRIAPRAREQQLELHLKRLKKALYDEIQKLKAKTTP